jgi:hypothetical protein
MKTLNLLFVLILSWGCTSRKAALVSPDLYLKLNKQHLPKHRACQLHRDKLVAKAFTEAEDAELDDEHYFFIRNEKSALKYINAFDLTKFTLVENQQEYQAIIQGCVFKKDAKHQTCDTLSVTYKFFRGLVYGLRQYPWSDSTKRRATQVTLSYLDYVARSNSSIMDILLANDILQRLAEHAYINPDLYTATWEFKTMGEKKFEELKEKVRKLGKKDLSCEEANLFYADEREKVKELSESFLKLLQKAQIS